jgi:hypothetical protein
LEISRMVAGEEFEPLKAKPGGFTVPTKKWVKRVTVNAPKKT